MLLRVGENIQAYNASCEAVAAAVATAVEATVQLTSVPSNYRPK
jgi:acetylglutamate kinase